jgi:hypothetical protein
VYDADYFLLCDFFRSEAIAVSLYKEFARFFTYNAVNKMVVSVGEEDNLSRLEFVERRNRRDNKRFGTIAPEVGLHASSSHAQLYMKSFR